MNRKIIYWISSKNLIRNTVFCFGLLQNLFLYSIWPIGSNQGNFRGRSQNCLFLIFQFEEKSVDSASYHLGNSIGRFFRLLHSSNAKRQISHSKKYLLAGCVISYHRARIKDVIFRMQSCLC